jgi:hypothetical protein
MKAKLIKIDKDNYTLFDEKGIPIGTTPNVLSNNTFSKLSKQNCDEIFGVIDVEKLAGELYSGHVMAVDWQLEKSGFIKGFNKAMELNKDKMFTLEQMQKAFEFGKQVEREDCNDNFQEYLISIKQPTEIDVEIEMEKVPSAWMYTKLGELRPKLDSQGCLILKRVV